MSSIRKHLVRFTQLPERACCAVAVVSALTWAVPVLLSVAVSEGAAVAQESQEGANPTKPERKAAKKAEKERREAEKRAAKEAKLRKSGRYGGRTAESLLADARGYMEQDKFLRAREILLFLEDNERALNVQDDVKLLLADSYFGEGGTLNWVEALARYRTFLTFFPKHPEVARAQYRIGMCYLNQAPKSNRDQSTTGNALYEFQKLIELYPNSNWSDQAQGRIAEARELLATAEHQIAEFYLVRGHDQAAIGRLQGILSDYPDYDRKADVYRELAQAHYRLGSRIEGDIYSDKYKELGGSQSINAKPAKSLKKKKKKEQAADASDRASVRGASVTGETKKSRKAAEKEAEKAAKRAKKAEEKAEKEARKAEKKAAKDQEKDSNESEEK